MKEARGPSFLSCRSLTPVKDTRVKYDRMFILVRFNFLKTVLLKAVAENVVTAVLKRMN